MKRMLAALVLMLAVTVPALTPVPAPAAEKLRSFTTEAEALSACGREVVVWVNKNSKVFHLREARWYGKTKDGAYACRPEAEKAGFHQSKGGN
jgi:hypothetical protein